MAENPVPEGTRTRTVLRWMYLVLGRAGGGLFRWAAAALLASTVLMAQNASLSGTVTDPSGGVVRDAEVTLGNELTSAQIHGRSNNDGVYVFSFVPAGRYTLSASASGFHKFEQTHLTVETGQNALVNVQLQLGDTSQTVTVDASGTLINTVDGSVSTLVDRQFVENIPLNGRSFQSLMTAVPGVAAVPSLGAGESGELTVNGQRAEANYFIVDGVSANTGSSAASGTTGYGAGFTGALAGETVLGTTQALVSLEDLEEFRASTSSYSAQYGRTPGGQFIFNTRSGTNEWHGSGFEYLRNGDMDANNWFNNASGFAKQGSRQNDFGGTLGGPLTIPHVYNGKNRTFFFFSYEGLRLRSQQAAVLTGVPSLSLRQAAPAALQPILNAYPLPNGIDRGDGIAYFTSGYTSPSSIDATSIRVDHRFSDSFSIFGRYSQTPSSILSRDSGDLATLISFENHVKTLTLGATNIITPRLTTSLRFNVTWNDGEAADTMTNFGGAAPFSLDSLPGFQNSPTNWFIFNLFFDIHARMGVAPQSTTQRQFNVTDTWSASFGRHNLTWGVDYRRLNNSETLPTMYEFGYVTSESQILSNTMTGITVKQSLLPMQPFSTNFSAYLQDEWKLHPKLSLSLGLRWDLNPAPGDSGGNLPYTVTNTNLLTALVAPKGTPLWATTYRNFAPRLGLAYRAREKSGHETVLRTGFGLFYDLADPNSALGYGGIGTSSSLSLVNLSFPLTTAQLAQLPGASVTVPYSSTVQGFDPHLQLPYTLQWNAAVEQGLGEHQRLTVTYLGASGHRLYSNREYYPAALGNTNFTSAASLLINANNGFSNYDALQVQFERRMAHGLQILSSYTWSHSLDNLSTNFLSLTQEYSSSDFDIRHNFQTALTWSIPAPHGDNALLAAVKNWAIDSRFSARSALPVDIIGVEAVDPSSGASLNYHPNLTGQPLYVSNPSVPGGRAINYAAFAAVPSGIEGDLGRNALRGFDAVQLDLSCGVNSPFSSGSACSFGQKPSIC